MSVDSGTVTALATVTIALINMIGSVLLAFIRARYGVTEHLNGVGTPAAPTPTPSAGHGAPGGHA